MNVVPEARFCTNCGASREVGARFCTGCGMELIGAAQVPPAIDLVSQALSPDTSERERATRRIIDSVDVSTMSRCGHTALSNGDLERAEFWFMEVATAEADDRVRSDGIEDLSRLVYLPADRLEEAEVYTRTVLGHADPRVRARALQTLADIEMRRATQSIVRLEYSDAWRDIDLTEPLRAGAGQFEHYHRLLAFLFYKDQTNENARLLEGMREDYMQCVTGYLIGFSSSTSRTGIDRETAVRALIDWYEHR